MPKLKNPKWERFCQAYVAGETAGNAGRSYARAFGKTEASRSSEVLGSRLRGKDLIACRIGELTERARANESKATDEAAQKLALSKERLLEELSRTAFVDLSKYVTLDRSGQPQVDFDAVRRDKVAAFHELVIDAGGQAAVASGSESAPGAEAPRVRMKLGGKHEALRDLGKHLGLFKEKHEITHVYETMTNEQLSAELNDIAERLAALGIDFGPPRSRREDH